VEKGRKEERYKQFLSKRANFPPNPIPFGKFVKLIKKL